MTKEQELFSECKAMAQRVSIAGGWAAVFRNACIFALGMGFGSTIEASGMQSPALVFFSLSALSLVAMMHFDMKHKMMDSRLKLKQSELHREQSKPTTPEI